MDPNLKIPGRIGTRVVGALELIAGLVLFGIWIWVMVINTSKLMHDSTFSIILILFGIFLMAGVVGGIILLYATFTHASLNIRKNLSIIWAIYRTISFVGGIILMCTTKWFAEVEWFILMVGLVLKWLVFICVVCAYIWRISEAIEERKTASSLASSTSSFSSKIAQQKIQWQQIQQTQNYGVFATKKQFLS